MPLREAYEYYGTSRGTVPNYLNASRECVQVRLVGAERDGDLRDGFAWKTRPAHLPSAGREAD
jgi:hypothetical protein